MDYQAIIENLKVESVIELMQKLGADRYEDKGDYIIFPTICHNENAAEASMKLYFYKENKYFMCYTECEGMSIFKFLKTYYQNRNIEYDWYEDVYQVILDCSNYKFDPNHITVQYHKLEEKFGKKMKPAELPVYNEGALDCFVKRYPPEWLNDNISKAAMDKYQILFSIAQNKIIIPHRSVNGALCGIRGRALNEWDIENLGKYMPVQLEQTWYKHPLSLNLYGLYQNKENIKQNKICYVFESEKAVLQFESYSLPHCGVAVCGSQFNKYQLHLLMKYCAPHEIVICFDNEELPGQHKYFDKLNNICNKYKQYCNFSFIYDRHGLTRLKDSPSDNGEEVFQKLLKERIKVI